MLNASDEKVNNNFRVSNIKLLIILQKLNQNLILTKKQTFFGSGICGEIMQLGLTIFE